MRKIIYPIIMVFTISYVNNNEAAFRLRIIRKDKLYLLLGINAGLISLLQKQNSMAMAITCLYFFKKAYEGLI